MPNYLDEYQKAETVFKKGKVKIQRRWGNWNLYLEGCNYQLATKHSTTGHPEDWARKKTVQRINSALQEIERYEALVEEARQKLKNWEKVAKELGMELEDA